MIKTSLDQAPPNSQLMRKDVTPYVPSGNELTENRLNGLLASDNPYIQAARARGEAQAARRGLLNSSIAGQAGETAAINAATPIAQADAERFHQAKMAGYQGNIQNWLAGQQYARAVDLANQRYQQQVGLIGVQEGASSRLSAQEYNQRAGLANINNAAMLQRTGLGIQGQQQLANINNAAMLQRTGLQVQGQENLANVNNAAMLQRTGLQVQGQENLANINNAAMLQRTGLQVQGQENLANINNAARLNLEAQRALWDKQLRTILAGMQLSSEERRNFGAQAQSLGQEYLVQVSNAQRDPNVSADAKSGVLASLQQTYQARLTDLGKIYGVNISWT